MLFNKKDITLEILVLKLLFDYQNMKIIFLKTKTYVIVLILGWFDLLDNWEYVCYLDLSKVFFSPDPYIYIYM
jgi:hypothetical protein